MLSKAEAMQIAQGHLTTTYLSLDLVLLTDETVEFELGWVFFYQSRLYLDTGDYRDMLGGNAPIIVNKHTATISITGTAYPVEKYIADYLNAQ